ncbi:MAG: hypothetical protein OEV49_00740 [candidate division Zixibacteria bacterium]|nr:hypothetical protein [candidate division Zixibacteria bacterium]MDH3938458.1 hypothetical protein [candidate division Zixibacteria bacterium]MDH4033732.1 hypothetical protein [candidate division Zixibacteria bacterium]
MIPRAVLTTRYIAALAILLMTTAVSAAVPTTMNYQGRLTDDTGDPVADGDYSVTFTIYDSFEAGADLWTETRTVATTNGLFTVLLGEVNPLTNSVFDGGTRYLGIQIGADPEYSPRIALVAVPYALRSEMSDSAQAALEAQTAISATSAAQAGIADSADAVTDGGIDLADIGQNGASEGQIMKWVGSSWTLADDSIGGSTTGWNWSDSSSYGPDTVAMAGNFIAPLSLNTNTEDPIFSLKNFGNGPAVDLWMMGLGTSKTALRAAVTGGQNYNIAINGAATGDIGGKTGGRFTADGLGTNYGSYAEAHDGEVNYAFYGRSYGDEANYGLSVTAEDGTHNYGIYSQANSDGVVTADNNYGVFSTAQGANVNYALYGGVGGGEPTATNYGLYVAADGAGHNTAISASASGGVSNRAANLNGDVFVMGNTSMRGDLMISRSTIDSPVWEFDTESNHLNFYEWGSDQDRRTMQLSGWTYGQIKMFHQADTAVDQVRIYAGPNGGQLKLKDTNDSVTIAFMGNGSTYLNNQRVVLHEESVDDLELMNEPGIVLDRNTGCHTISALNTMEDVATVRIQIPAPGYIVLNGHAFAEISGTTNNGRIKAQIDETEGGSATAGYYTRIGLGAYVSAGSSFFSDFDVNCHRVYYKDSAGFYDFRFEALKENTITAKICYGSLTATYFPTSYGTVQAVSNMGDAGMDQTGAGDPTPVNNPTIQTVDLREREIAEKQARREKTKAALEELTSDEESR